MVEMPSLQKAAEIESWLPVCNPLHNHSHSPAVNWKPLWFNEISKSLLLPVNRKRRQSRFPNYSTQRGCRKSSR